MSQSPLAELRQLLDAISGEYPYFKRWHMMSPDATPIASMTQSFLEDIFVSLEDRLSILHGGNHHQRQLARWLGRWQKLVSLELDRRRR